MSKITRREFLEESLLAAAAATLGAAALPRLARADEALPKTVGPNDAIHMAVMGVNGQGMSHVEQLLKQKDVILMAICDADSAAGERACKYVEEKTGQRPRYQQDIRKLLEDKNLDAFSIATPNHWHSLAAIWGVQAGKDVYVEKPVSHNISEGRRVVEVARKYKRIVQTGTQCRSQEGTRQAIQFLRDGKLGKVKVARGLCYKPRGSIGKVKGPKPPPATVNYDLWSGPAPLKPIMREKFHYDWHWQWDYGSGDIGNQGIHQMDVARWGLGKDSLAHTVVSIGGRFSYDDDGQTPNTQISILDYGDSQLIFEVRGLNTADYKAANVGTGAKIGVVFHCENGYMVCPSYSSGVAFDLNGKEIAKFDKGGDHFRNFLNAVRSRKHTDLNADIEQGHLSSALCHLGNISHRLGTAKIYDEKEKPFGKNEAAYETFGRFRKHLQDNGVDLAKTKVQLGRFLKVNTKAENFGFGHHAANVMLTRDYRKPFVVPTKV